MTRTETQKANSRRASAIYTARHPERVRANGKKANAKHYLKNSEMICEAKRLQYAKDPGPMRESSYRWKDENPITPTYGSWKSMLLRCRNPNATGYERYGGRGIEVCDRWDTWKGGSFANFLEDLGERPEGTSLDRIDNDKGYEPGNIRWATRKEQAANRRPRI